MSGVKVLDFVARELKGRILTASSVAAFVAAEQAADRLDMGRISRDAAELAVLLPKIPVERIRDEFGPATADIVEAIRVSSPYSTIALEAMVLHGTSKDDEIRRDAAIAAYAAETAVANPEDRDRMARLLNDMVGQEADAERRAFLTELRAQLLDPSQTDREGGSGGRTKLISISMDVCGSTEMKARMKTRARDEKELTRWYENFHREFVSLEWCFYRALFKAAPSKVGLDWKHGFVVKGIGDEVWLLYEVREKELWKLRSLTACLLHSALDVANRLIHWTSARDDDEDGGDGRWESRCLPLKFYIDTIDDAFEVSGPRCDFMMQRLPEILGAQENWSGEDSIELGNRLHAGSLMGDGRRLLTSIRTDYIGWEVDRFFRATKFALPCVVTVGRGLFEEVVDVSEDSDESLGGTGLQRAVVACPIDRLGGTRFDNTFRYVKQDIGASELTGVGSDYSVYRVLRENDLLSLRYNGVAKEIMRKTFEVFTPAMEDAVRPARRK